MKLRRLAGRRRPERVAHLGLDALFPSNEVYPASDLEAEGVVLGMKDAVEVGKHEGIQCSRGTI